MLLPSESNATLAEGYLLFLQGGTLMAQRFDERHGELAGGPVPVAQSVTYNPSTWRAAFDVSRNGILAYQAGSSAQESEQLWQAPGKKLPAKAVAEKGQVRTRSAFSQRCTNLPLRLANHAVSFGFWI